MHRPARFVSLLVVVLLTLACAPTWRLPDAPLPALSAEGIAPPWADAVGESRQILRARLREMPGLAAAVGDRRRVLWSEGFGLAELGEGRAVEPETRFRIYSLAKPITATLAVRLQEQGRLSLEAPIGGYLPGLPSELSRVTLEQLLSHTAGVRHYRRGEWPKVSRTNCETALEALAPFRDDPLMAEPETEFRYSSFGFVLASAVLAAAADEGFYELLRREILEPAGMSATVVDSPPYDRSTTSEFYLPARFGRVRKAHAWDNSCKWGAGGLLSTAEDLARFGGALLGGKLVGPEGLELLWTSRRMRSGEPLDYGLGWGLETGDDGKVTLAAASGGSPGGRSYLLLDPPAGMVVSLAANLEGERLDAEARQVRDAFLRSEPWRTELHER